MKFNWDQKGMPVSLVSRMGRRNEFSDFKSVLNDARNHVMQPVDAELMARDLVHGGGREYVEIVRELTAALENAQKELEEANRRYERLTADLAKRGISVTENRVRRQKPKAPAEEPAKERSAPAAEPSAEGLSEWEEWDRRFKALLG